MLYFYAIIASVLFIITGTDMKNGVLGKPNSFSHWLIFFLALTVGYIFRQKYEQETGKEIDVIIYYSIVTLLLIFGVILRKIFTKKRKKVV